MQEVTGYVYVAHAPNRGLYKIGQSINPEQRMISIAPAAEQVQLVLKIPSSDSWWLERHLHKAFVAKSAGGEWFKLSQVDIRLLGSIAYADSEKDLPRKINDLAFRGRNVRRKSPPVFVTGGKKIIRLDVDPVAAATAQDRRCLMERFRLRVKQQARKGQIWELHMFPAVSGRATKESDAKVMGLSAAPETIQWLRELSEPFLEQAEEPGPIKASEFRPGTPPRWLRHADGMRLALGFASARYLTKAAQRKMFRDGLLELPAEVVLYWFTLCFYGYRQLAGKAALRTLLTYEQPAEKPKPEPKPKPSKKNKKASSPTLFETNGEAEEKPKKRSGKKART